MAKTGVRAVPDVDFRGRLIEERRRVLAEALALAGRERQFVEARHLTVIGGDGDGSGSDAAELASDLHEQEVLARLGYTVRAHLRDVEDALRRFDEGTYGLCEDCHSEINPLRIQARPWARRCVDCQQRWERVAA